MRIITADETGLIKVVRLESGECLAVSAGEQAREHAVRAICHKHAASPASTTSHQEEGHFGSVHVVRSVGAVETWDMSQSEREGSNGNACSLTLDGTPVECPSQPVAIASLSPGLGSSEASRVLTCNADGEVQVVTYATSGPPKQARFSIRGPISAAITAATGAAGQALAAAGKNNDLKIWDISTNQCTWKAKNVPHDFLDMQLPVWITSLRSLLPGANNSSGGDGSGGGGGLQQLVAGTAHRQVRLYDARAQKRPTHSVDADEHGITTMAVAPDGREVVVADTAGLVRVLDLRKMKWGRRFEGPAGSVRGLAFHPTLPVLACVGLDRMARVFDYRSREQTFQVYLKQRLNAVLFDGEEEVRVAAGTAQGEDKKEGRGSGKGEDWSGSEGWGSGEEYEMDEGDSSEEEEEEEGRGGGDKRRARADVTANGRGRAGSSGSSSSSSEGDSGEGSGSESDDSSGERREGGEGGDSSSSGSQEVDDDDPESESESEEEAKAPPPKRHSAKANGSIPAKKSRRK